MRVLAWLLLIAAAPVLATTTLYKWVDDQGVVHYSDQPEPGAEKIKVRSAQTFKGTPASNQGPGIQQNQPAATRYARLAIETPVADQVLLNESGVLVVASVEPALQPGHQLLYMLDGRPVDGLGPESTSVTLDSVPRGSHTIAVIILDETGSTVASSAAVSFAVREPSTNKAPKGPSITPH
jgi:hypothetical protein